MPSASPVISDDGAAVAFEVGVGAETRIAVRDHTDGTTTFLDRPGAAPAVSADGCVVAYVAPDVSGGTDDVDLVAVNRCSTESFVVDSIRSPVERAVPAISGDGSFIAWSRGDVVVRYEFDDGAWQRAGEFDTVVGGDPAAVTGTRVDLSDDGLIVVFEAGPSGTVFAPEPVNVYRWQESDGSANIDVVSSVSGQPGAADSLDPSVSGDGSVVTFTSTSSELIGGVDEALGAPFVAAVSSDDPPRLVAAEADQAELSGDGTRAVYRSGDDLRVVYWPDGAPSDRQLDELLLGEVGEEPWPGISRHGRWVVFASSNGAEFTVDTRFHDDDHVWTATRPRPSSPSSADLGAGRPGDVLTAKVSVDNDAEFDLPIDEVAVSDPFEIRRTTCAELLRSAEECEVTVAVTIDEPGELVGRLVITTAGWSPTRLESEVVATGRAAPPTTSTTTPTVSRWPVYVPPARVPSATPPPGTVRRTPTVVITAATSDPPSTETSRPATIRPSTLAFGDAIVQAGRESSGVTLSAPSRDVEVTDIRLEPESTQEFSLTGGSCRTGIPADDCTIALDFTPQRVGEREATLVVEFADGEMVTATVTGTGLEPPTLTLVPRVVAPGQVMTVVGAGFPARLEVDIMGFDGALRYSVETDSDGTFRATVPVLPREPAGPAVVRVPEQPDRFGSVEAPVLVGRNSDPSRSLASFSVGAGI